MNPTDPSSGHLTDRAAELRALKSAVVVFLVTLAAVFYPWIPVLVVFTLGYVAYKFRYYTRRVGVYTNEDLSARQDRLESALLAFAVAAVGVLIAIQTVFDESWDRGGFLSLPSIEFTDFDALLNDPIVPLAWLAVVVPVLAASYVWVQFRKRLLAGVNTYPAAVRATAWDSLGGVPIAVLWVVVFSMRPVYEVWEPLVETLRTELDLVTEASTGFAVVFGQAFDPVVVVGALSPAVVAGAYLAVQQPKYDDLSVPGVLGYRGISPPSRGVHRANVAVPIGVYLLYAAAVVLTVETLPLDDQQLLAGVAVSVLVGANVLAKTTTTVRSLSADLADNVDGFVSGLVVGFAVLVVLGPVLGAETPLPVLALAYPVVAVPATFGANWLTGKRAARQTSAYSDRVETDWSAFDEQTVDRLFVYSTARDNTLRGAAVRGLASSVQATAYRQDEAIAVLGDALWSNEEAIVHSGLRGLGAVLDYDRSAATHEWLENTGVAEQIVSRLDSENRRTRVLAAEAAANMFTGDLGRNRTASADRLTQPHVGQLAGIAEENTGNQRLMSAVSEYFATLWYAVSRSDDGVRATDQHLQYVLGSALWMAAHSSESARFRVALALTGDRAVADEDRFSLATDHLDSQHEEVRFASAHVVRSSMERHVDRIDTEQLVALLGDPSGAVRRMAAASLVALVGVDPGRATQLRDRLVDHLEENAGSPGATERDVVRALAGLEPEVVSSHPTAAGTIATYVERSGTLVAPPAAGLLATLVESSQGVARQEAVRTAIRAGLTHDSPEVRLGCLDAAVAIVERSVENGRQFVPGLGANLATEGRHGVLAAVTLAQIVEEHPEDALELVGELSAGLRNRTRIDAQTVPFLIRGGTVSAVVVDVVREAVALDPGRFEQVIDPLVDLATAAEQSTLGGIVRVLSVLSEEFPDESTAAVEAAAVAIENRSVSVRSDAAQVLANVAAYHPETVAPFVDRLIVATDDTSPRVRAPALAALENVCAAIPEVVEDDVHRIIGRLDDDSAIVRKQAAQLVSTVANRKPDVVDPAAETADRLRRLQRDPAVDVDPAELQDASTAIQTGVAAEEAESQDREEIWSPESSDEMGVSGDTEVFEPVGDDFDPDFEAEFEDEDGAGGPPEAAEHGSSPGGPESVGDQDTVVESDDSSDAVGDQETAIEPDDSSDAVGDQETVIEPDDSSDAVGDQETAIEPDDDRDGEQSGAGGSSDGS